MTAPQDNRASRTRKGPPFRMVPPRPAVLKGLGSEDRHLLESYLFERMEFVDHPALHETDAEVCIFGCQAVPSARGATHLEAPTPVVEWWSGPEGRVPTLTGEQEKALFLRYNYARMRVAELQDRYVEKPLAAKPAREMLGWLHRALEARGVIARVNMPLVLAMAKRTKLTSIDHTELVSEGNLALLRSVEKFDCGRGFKFSTYACRAILKSFSRVAMRVGRYRGRFPTEFDPAIERSDYLERKREETELNCVDEVKEILLQNLAGLTDVERIVIHERFALPPIAQEDATPKTLEQVGVIIGVTKERVRQIQNKALHKIRLALEEKYLAA